MNIDETFGIRTYSTLSVETSCFFIFRELFCFVQKKQTFSQLNKHIKLVGGSRSLLMQLTKKSLSSGIYRLHAVGKMTNENAQVAHCRSGNTITNS